MKKNAIVGQSGGPTAVINASLYGVVYEALNREDVIGTIYGMINGIEGFLNENMMDMKPLEVNGELELIKTTPGSYLGSCRYKLPEDLTDAVYPQLFEKFEKCRHQSDNDVRRSRRAVMGWRHGSRPRHGRRG